MNRACWPATIDGHYFMTMAVAGVPLRCTIDLGLVDPLDRIGLELEPATYDALERAGRLADIQKRERRDASGRRTLLPSGATTAQLLDPATRQPVGPVIHLYAFRGSTYPSRVGVVFFHRLAGWRVDWDLGNKIWCVEYP